MCRVIWGSLNGNAGGAARGLAGVVEVGVTSRQMAYDTATLEERAQGAGGAGALELFSREARGVRRRGHGGQPGGLVKKVFKAALKKHLFFIFLLLHGQCFCTQATRVGGLKDPY